MKQSTVKTLGAAALGAAFVAAAAGSASAAPLSSGVQSTTDDVVHTLPVHEAADTLPGRSGEVVETGADMLSGESSALPVADQTLSHTAANAPGQAETLLEPATQLLGGLPIQPDGLAGLPASDLLGGLHLG
ncbi:ATP-binding protein [Streptomyces hoynatensis]|uniref:ATP-binding protein n=1 Tax=Streptomyces hoynatensis TaxID=1141874 RepID=A0A3A9ZEX8_9ACTN|nr:ATP-binding protein [Streptomyces hoynatensis]RKN46900.1 ATP-binding protein [Streptomyces hoynatensis]